MSGRVKRSLRVLKSFVGAVKVTVEGVEFAIDIDGEPGVVDTRGDIARPGRWRVNRPRRVAPPPDAAGQRLGQAEPAFRRAQQRQRAIGRDLRRRKAP